MDEWILELTGPLYHTSNSAIHKAAVQPASVQDGLWRVLCTVASFDILGIMPGKPVEQL